MLFRSVAVALLASADASMGVGVAIVALSCVFVMSFAYGWGPLAWTVCSEIYPTRHRSRATSASELSAPALKSVPSCHVVAARLVSRAS